MRVDDERLAEAVTRFVKGPGSGDCPDTDVLAGFCEGRLAPDERGPVVAHVADCDPCQRQVAATAEALGEVTAAAPEGRVLRFPGALTAVAAAVVLVLLGWWAMDDRGPVITGPLTEAVLVAAATDLEAAHPDLYEGFRPLTADERAAPGPAAERGGIRLATPRAARLDGRPVYRWAAVPGATSYTVTVRDEFGAVVLEQQTTEPRLEHPTDGGELAAGTGFVWKVVATGPAGEAYGSAAFRRVSADHAKRFRRAEAMLSDEFQADAAALLAADYAVRHDLFEEARRLLAGTTSELAADRRAHVDRRLGASE